MAPGMRDAAAATAQCDCAICECWFAAARRRYTTLRCVGPHPVSPMQTKPARLRSARPPVEYLDEIDWSPGLVDCTSTKREPR